MIMCFRRNVVGDCKSVQYVQFWTAVRRFAPTVRFSSDIVAPLSTRTVHELLPAYDMVAHLLQERHPAAWRTFVANGHSVTCQPVPELRAEVETFLRGSSAPDDAQRVRLGILYGLQRCRVEGVGPVSGSLWLRLLGRPQA